MKPTDLFSVYVRTRLDEWGREFAYHRDREFSGRAPKNVLQTLIEHKGEMPHGGGGARPEVTETAMQVEDIVRGIHQTGDRTQSRALRAYFCGSGRCGVERYEFFVALMGRHVGRSAYFRYVEAGTAVVRAELLRCAQTGNRAA